MPYLLLQDGFHLLLQDASGSLTLEGGGVVCGTPALAVSVAGTPTVALSVAGTPAVEAC